jgi:hypothetical protein
MFLMSTRRTSETPRQNTVMRLNRNPAQQSNIIKPVVQPEPPKPPQMKWGAPTWTYLHTMAEKVKESSFPAIRKEMYRVIYMICTNLPCSMCSNHAKEYLNKINVQSIQTKQDLKNMLFVFHNEVNKRKGFAIFPNSNLDDKYSTGNYRAIANNFMIFYQEKSRNKHFIADEMYRQRVVSQVKQWIIENIEHFDL